MQLRSFLPLLLAAPLLAAAGQVDNVSVEKIGERYQVDGQITVAASVGAVFRLITDYDSLETLDKGIASSRLIERIGDNAALVYTQLSGCIVFFCRKVNRIERVDEISGSEIIAVVVPDKDGNVAYGRSQWQLFPDGNGTRVVFQSEIEPDFWIPSVLGPTLIKSVLKKRLSRTLDNLEQAAHAYE